MHNYFSNPSVFHTRLTKTLSRSSFKKLQRAKKTATKKTGLNRHKRISKVFEKDKIQNLIVPTIRTWAPSL